MQIIMVEKNIDITKKKTDRGLSDLYWQSRPSLQLHWSSIWMLTQGPEWAIWLESFMIDKTLIKSRHASDFCYTKQHNKNERVGVNVYINQTKGMHA